MLCRNCMSVMKGGTTYEHNKDGNPLARRFYECKRCHNRIYTNESNFQEYLNKATEKFGNK